jgi:hypothetical protein
MALNDVEAFREWLEREDPSYLLMRAVRNWIDGLDAAPWQAPSSPITEMSVEGQSQVREATIFGIDVIYEENFQTGDINLIHVGRHQGDESGSGS